MNDIQALVKPIYESYKIEEFLARIITHQLQKPPERSKSPIQI